MSDVIKLPFNDFIELPVENLLNDLSNNHFSCMREQPSDSQVKAWKSSIVFLKNSLKTFLYNHPEAKDSTIIIEYELPRERGRRPDVLLLFNSSIIVLEFKEHFSIKQSFIDQVSAYARDLKHYQEYSHVLELIPVLLLMKSNGLKDICDDVTILSPDTFEAYLNNFWSYESQKAQLINKEKWHLGNYLPLPSLIEAAKKIFQHEPLPSIRRASSAGIPETLKKLHEIAQIAKSKNEHHLALITGVPGAGKTLVGISFVYEVFNIDNETKEAVLLSGNGPLVKVLQYALKSTAFVQDVHGFLKTHGGSSDKLPREAVFIYDEAQRAWDKKRVQEKRGHNSSEPEDFLQIGSKKTWSLMIGLIGEGQEIYLGEEAGLKQWNEAISSSKTSWKVHCPSKLHTVFTNASETNIIEELNLTQTLRSHLAEDVQKWVNSVLEGNVNEASSFVEKINKEGFDMYVTRDLSKAKNYVLERYSNSIDKKFGLIASSKSKLLPKYGVANDFMSTKLVKEGPWYIDDKTSPFSCCQLKQVVTEFGCQGLELDFPIVCWENDFIMKDGKWQEIRTTKLAQDSFTLRKNSYRVLLSRGRDGMIIFLPDDSSLDETYAYFKNCGIPSI